MAKNLKGKLLEFQTEFDAYAINEYFATDFADDYGEYEQDKNNIEALEYLNDEFIDIDIDYSHTKEFDNKVKEVIEKALELLK